MGTAGDVSRTGSGLAGRENKCMVQYVKKERITRYFDDVIQTTIVECPSFCLVLDGEREKTFAHRTIPFGTQ